MRDSEDLVTRARRALVEANAGTPPRESSLLVAGLAHHLAQHGHAEKVSVKIAETSEAAQDVLSFLAQRHQTASPETAPDDLDTLQDGSAPSALKPSVHKRTRPCVECGQSFEVNPSHVKTHKCCRPACRARRHRRLRGVPR